MGDQINKLNRKILVLGANGMLGGSVFRYLTSCAAYNVIGSVRSKDVEKTLNNLGFANVVSGVDVRDLKLVDELIGATKPEIVINCIGLIKQLSSARSPISAIEINSLLPHQVAEVCTNHGARLVHFSTDCVFSGSKGMYTEQDVPDAIDLYGRSKFLGEVDYDGHLTFRTSILGHEMNGSVSLIDWFLGQTGSVNGFSNAVFSGLPTVCVAEFLEEHVLNQFLSGLFHLSVEPIDKYRLLNIVADVYDKKVKIHRSDSFIIDRSLDCTKLRDAVGFKPINWESLVKKMHNEYCQYFA